MRCIPCRMGSFREKYNFIFLNQELCSHGLISVSSLFNRASSVFEQRFIVIHIFNLTQKASGNACCRFLPQKTTRMIHYIYTCIFYSYPFSSVASRFVTSCRPDLAMDVDIVKVQLSGSPYEQRATGGMLTCKFSKCGYV